MYGGLAVLMGLSAPLFWTFRTYFTRRTINDKSYEVNDLAIDTVLAQAIIQTLIYAAYLSANDFDLNEFIQG